MFHFKISYKQQSTDLKLIECDEWPSNVKLTVNTWKSCFFSHENITQLHKTLTRHIGTSNRNDWGLFWIIQDISHFMCVFYHLTKIFGSFIHILASCRASQNFISFDIFPKADFWCQPDFPNSPTDFNSNLFRPTFCSALL